MSSPKNTINREIMALATPAIISNITTPLLGLADTAVTGHMGGAAYVGAIAIGGSMVSMAYWTLGFLRMGTSGLTAQSFGHDATAGFGKASTTEIWLWRSLVVGLLMSIVVIILSPVIARLLLLFMDSDPTSSALARRYFMIVVFGAPAVLASYSISGWLIGMQDSAGPMWMAILTNISNIALSIVFVFLCRMGIEGVALGTLIAQWLGALLGILLARAKMKGLRIPSISEIADRAELKRFFSINSDIFLRTLCLVAVTLYFTRTGARQGAVILAANAVLLQLFLLFSYFMDGFAFAAEALSGKYKGMDDHKRLLSAIKQIFIWGGALAVAFTIAYALGGKLFITLITDEDAVAHAAFMYLPWAVAVPLTGMAAFAWDGVYIGMTMTRQMLWSMAAATAIFFVLDIYLPQVYGNHSLWIAFLSYLFTRGIMQTFLFCKSQIISYKIQKR